MREEVERVAAGLSEAQRASIRSLDTDWRTFNRKSYFDLPSGIALWRPSSNIGAIDLRLSRFGYEVRKALLARKNSESEL